MFKPEDFDIIDMHTHPFTAPDTLIGRYWRGGSTADFVREMHKVGIRKFAGSVVRNTCGPADFAAIRWLNREALRVRDAYPEAYIPGVHVHPGYVEESCAELCAMHAEGVRLIGELVPYILGGWTYGDPGFMTICREAEQLGMTVNLHGGEEAELAPILRACPRLKVILAHPGDTNTAPQRFDFVSRYPNLHMDVSGTGLFRWGMLRYAVDVCGPEKLLFGSDMPTCSAGMFLYGTLSENLTREEFDLVLGGNFRRLLGL